MHDLAEFPDLRLEHTMRARVGDHHRREPIGILLALRAELGHVDVAVGIAARHDHLHADHMRAGGVCAVR